MIPAVKTVSLSKNFYSIKAVEELNLTIYPGEILGFLGPNGAGKSTTMKMLTGFITPTSGKAYIHDIDIQENPIGAKKLIGYLPEGAPAYPDMTPLEFLNFIAEVRGYKCKEKTKKVEQVITKINLTEVCNQNFETLSKGFKRRVGLAQAIIHAPKVLILDEPTDGLDPNQKHEIRSLIKDMAKDTAIILSTHTLEEVEAICSRAIIIASGKIIADASPQKLAERSPVHNTVQIRIANKFAKSAENAFKEIRNLQELIKLTEDNECTTFNAIPKPGNNIVNTISDICKNNNFPLLELSVLTGKLEEVFRKLTLDLQKRN